MGASQGYFRYCQDLTTDELRDLIKTLRAGGMLTPLRIAKVVLSTREIDKPKESNA